MLGRLLHLAGITFTIFELDKEPNFRSQGGTLDLHTDTGLAALKAAGLYDEFLKHARFDGEALLVADKKLTPWFQLSGAKPGSGRGRPEIDRSNLREILLESLPKDVIQWDHHLRRVDEDGTLHFDNGTTKKFDLIIGVDGAWSKVRALLSDQKPFYSGLGGYSFTIPDANQAPEVSEIINRGSCYTFSDGRSITGQQMGDGSLWISAYDRRDENWMKESSYDITNAQEVKAALRKEYADWSPKLVDFINKSSDKIVARNLYMLPVGFSWDHKPGFTLLGDAAHLMTPFAGEGVNLAFRDCLELCKRLIPALKSGSKDALDKSIRDYEVDMFQRAKKAQTLTLGKMNDMYFTPGAPRTSIDSWLLRSVEFQLGPILKPITYPLAALGIYGYFAFVRLQK